MSANARYSRSELDTAVSLQKLETTTNKGTVEHSYSTAVCLMAKVVPRASFTIKQADRITEGCTHLVIVDAHPSVKGSSRLVLPGDRVLEIVGLPRRDSEPRGRFFELDCREVE